MASEVRPVTPVSSLVQGSQALTTTIVIPKGGKNLPQAEQAARSAQADRSGRAGEPARAAAANASPLPSQIAQLNKYLNDSGRPEQFRASLDSKNIEEINPATGEVVAEYSAAEFPALARSVGISGAAVNSRA